ncbi:MAG: hypothetical protein E7Z80_03965 [Methanobrevibacter thaueri]|nr:hypothetical protein [Methanobrevibacter thaueri]
MKKCPKCGSVLSDFEPYCDYCGFDPDFDMGNWKKDTTSMKMPYPHGKHIKSSKDSEDNSEGIIGGIIFFGVLIFGVWGYLEMYHWDIGFLIASNFGSILLIIIFITIFCAACIYFNDI